MLARLLPDDDIALFDTFDDLDPIRADDPDLDILAALTITIFDHDEAAAFERTYRLRRQPERVVLTRNRQQNLYQIADIQIERFVLIAQVEGCIGVDRRAAVGQLGRQPLDPPLDRLAFVAREVQFDFLADADLGCILGADKIDHDFELRFVHHADNGFIGLHRVAGAYIDRGDLAVEGRVDLASVQL